MFRSGFNNSFHQRIDSIQYNAALAITGVVRGTSKKKFYQEPGFELLQSRGWFQTFSFTKYKKNNLIIILFQRQYILLVVLKTCFPWTFLSTLIEWNKLDSNIHSSPSYNDLTLTAIFNVPNSSGLTYSDRLRVGILHIFRDSLNSICNYGNATEAIKFYLLRGSDLKHER